LGWNQYPSTSGSPVGVSAPTANDSFRSGVEANGYAEGTATPTVTA
jgi:hypothetical protein